MVLQMKKDNIYKLISGERGKKLVMLADPDKMSREFLKGVETVFERAGVSMIFVGGSLVTSSAEEAVEKIKKRTSLPVVLFPGHPVQLAFNADAVLLLSLISGRNPEYLIGNHVVSAHRLKESGLEIIPAGYILVGDDVTTSVEYMSNTKPLPPSKPDLAVATAIAGEMLGMKIIYLEAGSGSSRSVPQSVISMVKENIGIPLIVGGGIRDEKTLEAVFSAGADVAVVGTAFEDNMEKASRFLSVVKKFSGSRQ